MRFLSAAILVSACGARTELGAPIAEKPDAPAASDASESPDVPEETTCAAIDYGVADLSSSVAGYAEFSARMTFALDDAFIYVVHGAQQNVLDRVPKKGGPFELVHTLSDDEAIRGGFVVDDTSVYWLSQGGVVHRVDKKSGDAAAIGCALFHACPPTFNDFPAVLATTEKNVIVLDGVTFGTLPKTGGSVAKIDVDNLPTGGVREVACDGTLMFWTTAVRPYSLDVTQAHPTVTHYGDWPTGLAIDDTRVYWTTATTIESATKENTSPTSIVATLAAPLAANATFVYGLTSAGVVKIPTTGGAPQVIAPGLTPTQLTLDGACLYMAAASGFLKRIPS